MKLEKLRMVSLELESEFRNDAITSAVYYFFEGRWHRLDDRAVVSDAISACLDKARMDPIAYHPASSRAAWLYINAIYPHREWLQRLCKYAGFTDIEFNPSKSINCQARSCALFVALMKNDLLERAVASPQVFRELISQYDYHPQLRAANA